MPRVADLPTPEERREATEPARLAARYKYAQDRVRRIVAAWPPLTSEQKSELAVIILSGGDHAAT